MVRGDRHSRSSRTLPERGLLHQCLKSQQEQFHDSSCSFCSPTVNFSMGVMKEIQASQTSDARFSSLWDFHEAYPVTSPPHTPQSK